MQTPLKWINELVNIKSINLENLIEKLTLGGFEVEEIIELEIENKKQLSLDISATANRSDSLSIQGISTEIATLLDQSIEISPYSMKTFSWKEQFENFSQSISNQSNCSTFLTIVVENLNDFTVPKWLKQKLLSSNVIPTNSLLDFQNYILLETGYPFEFYDFQKICSKLNSSNLTLSLSKAENGQEFLATNEISYKLTSGTSLIKANDFPISIAGIIKNKEFNYSNSTNSLLIEASIFNAAATRQQSRSLGLRTDRSARYEKSLKNTYLLESLYRLISLLRISNPKMICKLHTFAQSVEKLPKPISLSYKTVNEILGPIKKNSEEEELNYLSIETINNYLNQLNFKFSFNDLTSSWQIQIPPSRSDDIIREIDLIEEIGRLHGFNNFLTTLPKIKNIGNEDLSYQTRKKITSSLLNLGFNELVHYSLVNEITFKKNDIKLINPLLSDCSNLRSSLLPNLIKTVQENLKQGNSFIEGFEYGHVFLGDILTNFEEKEYIAGIFGGVKTKLTWSEAERSLTWFEAKGKIEQFFKQLNLLVYWQSSLSTNDQLFHPYRTAKLYFETGLEFGIFGQISPILANQLAISSEIYLFEFDLELIQSQLQRNKLAIFKDYSLYPKIIKDLSFIINQDIEFEKVKETLYCNGTKFLSEITLIDEYRGKSIPDGSTSLCFQLVFQSNEKTLENKEIENIIKSLESVLVTKFDASIRK